MNTESKLPKHVHIVGICGVATSAIAIALKNRGVKITGSDKGFFPPISTELEKHAIKFYAGWHPEKMVEEGKPDIVFVGGSGTSHSNPEVTFAKEQNIPVFSYAQMLGNYFVKKNSIVCAGTWGKTSSSTLLSFILDKAGFDPSYMFGGVSLSHDSSARLTNTDWSVLEGDEYQAAIWDKKAKFFYYKPTHLLLSAVSWDHADMYPTEKDYFDAFKKLVENIPKDGTIVACADRVGVNEIIKAFGGKIIRYGRAVPLNDTSRKYTYKNVVQSKNGLDFMINEYKIHSPLLGLYQAENITGCFAMASEIGIPSETIIAAIAEFKGLKRRLEKRFTGKITVFDDIAHSPEKAASVLSALRSIYNGKILAVFEPNIGGRNRDSAHKYDHAFDAAETVVIPRLTKLKLNLHDSTLPMEGDELTDIIRKTHTDARNIDDDEELVRFLMANTKKDDVIVFLGSHGFRGMIEEVIKQIS
jgi:UDP-N-acetylmuramate: L-alanyl-gamma-D-glutamyl-meso-diaminopimelate ligase